VAVILCSCASSVPSDTARDKCSLLGVTRHTNKLICEAAQKRDGEFAIHTSGFDCNWLKVAIVKEVITFAGLGQGFHF